MSLNQPVEVANQDTKTEDKKPATKPLKRRNLKGLLFKVFLFVVIFATGVVVGVVVLGGKQGSNKQAQRDSAQKKNQCQIFMDKADVQSEETEYFALFSSNQKATPQVMLLNPANIGAGRIEVDARLDTDGAWILLPSFERYLDLKNQELVLRKAVAGFRQSAIVVVKDFFEPSEAPVSNFLAYVSDNVWQALRADSESIWQIIRKEGQ